jgi:hypothetical protein
MREHIAALRAFFKEHHDIVDSVGDDRPTPRPNWAMQCSDDLDEMEARIPREMRDAAEGDECG